MATKSTRETQRQTILVQELGKVASLITGSFALPLNPAMLVSCLDIEVWWGLGRRGGLGRRSRCEWAGGGSVSWGGGRGVVWEEGLGD